MISVVIPTKDRQGFLLALLDVLEQQTQLPSEVIIIDQTAEPCVLLSSLSKFPIHYLHRPDIGSLCEAKTAGVEYSTKPFICFLDDDSRPDMKFFAELLSGMHETNAVGMCGFVQNYEHQSKIIKWAYPIFHRGFFRGDRMGVFGNDNPDCLPNYIKTHQVTGGCSIWKREVFDFVSFDLENKFHLFEDIDFSFQVNNVFRDRMFIDTKARIEDLNKEVGNRDLPQRFRMRMQEARKVYRKYGASGQISSTDYVLYVFGRGLEALVVSVRQRSLSPIAGYYRGITKQI